MRVGIVIGFVRGNLLIKNVFWIKELKVWNRFEKFEKGF